MKDAQQLVRVAPFACKEMLASKLFMRLDPAPGLQLQPTRSLERDDDAILISVLSTDQGSQDLICVVRNQLTLHCKIKTNQVEVQENLRALLLTDKMS